LSYLTRLVQLTRIIPADPAGRFAPVHRLSVGGSEKIQLTALLGAFKYAVELSQKR
jgi:hypothetical protein